MDARVLPNQPGDPRRLGPYELLGRLGQGGMGVVFLGRERRGGRLAAVKALRPELAGDSRFAARFRREVDAARRVDSPEVARVLDADPAAARPWLATEYVDGPTLGAAVAAGGPLAGERLHEFAAGVARALAAIHGAGIVHRDLKPSNVLLPSRPGAPGVKVIDFGIAWAADATMTRSGLRFGTPSWMAPEQLRDRPAGPPADVFAWGVLVAFAATGRHPFGGGPPEAVAYRILHHPPDLSGVPGSVRPLVRDALSRDPATRPTTARLATALAAAPPPTRVLPAAAVPGVAGEGPTRRRRGRRVGRLLAVAALLAGLVTVPHVVLAAVEGPDASAVEHSGHGSDRCHEDDEEEARDHDRDEVDDACGPDRDESGDRFEDEEDAVEGATEDHGGNRCDDKAPPPGSRGDQESPAAPGLPPPPTTLPASPAPRGPAAEPDPPVLGS